MKCTFDGLKSPMKDSLEASDDKNGLTESVKVRAGAAHEGVEALHHEGPPPGRELLVPHGRETRQCARNGLLSRLAGETRWL